MSKTFAFLSFLAGAAIASLVTWQCTKKHYADIAQEEIDSVTEVFSKRKQAEKKDIRTDETTATQEPLTQQKPDLSNYVETVKVAGYRNYTSYYDTTPPEVPETKEEEEDQDKPYVISPEEFDEMDGYDKISLTYYSDGILTSDDNKLVEDVGGTVGFDSLGQFGEYEDDSVFVRNDQLRCDFEILMDLRAYSDVVAGRRPHEV